MTADNAEDVASQVTSIVSNLDETDEQSEANLDLIVNVYDNIVDNLIDTNNFSVSTNVRQRNFTASSLCEILSAKLIYMFMLHTCTICLL